MCWPLASEAGLTFQHQGARCPSHHSNVTVAVAGGADARNVIKVTMSPGFSVLVVLCCQLWGFGLAERRSWSLQISPGLVYH